MPGANNQLFRNTPSDSFGTLVSLKGWPPKAYSFFVFVFVFFLSICLCICRCLLCVFVFIFVWKIFTWEWKWVTPISVLPPVDLHTRVVDLQKYQSGKPAFKYLSISTFICGTEWSCLTEFCFQIISFSGSSPPVQHWQCSHWSRTCRRCWGWPAPWTHRTRRSRPPPPRAPWDHRMASDSYHSYWTATYV